MPRGSSSGQDALAGEVAYQAQACGRLGSPLYRDLMLRAADDVRTGGVIARLLASHGAAPRGAAVALRLFGTVHRLALSGAAPELARWYPSCGGVADADRAWAAFLQVCHDHRSEVEAGLEQPPQTNEVGRGAALRGGYQLAVAATGLPLRLREIGASAGLNLRADRFRVTADGIHHGPATSPVVFEDGWTGHLPPATDVVVESRRGCDIAPVDPTTSDGALRLQSYVWPDQDDRLARLRGAIELAAEVPAEVVPQSAVDFLADLDPTPGVVTVVQHSVMWQYMDDDAREVAQGHVDRLARAATPEAPVARIALEPHRTADDSDVDYRGLGFAVTWACWPEHDERVVASAAPHGPPVDWLPKD